jgi:hypothetical protein
VSEGVNSSTSTGTNEGQTRGQTEGIHKRPLLTPDEIGMLFSRQDDKASPAYPGLALALLTGRQPVILRRTNYDEDTAFEGLFDPHPDHPFIPIPAPPARIEAKEDTSPDRGIQRALVDYYGPEKVDQALRIYRKYSYEAPGANILEDGPIVFAKAILDRGRENIRAVQKHGDRITLETYLDWMEGNISDLIREVGDKKTVDHLWFGTDRSRKTAMC